MATPSQTMIDEGMAWLNGLDLEEFDDLLEDLVDLTMYQGFDPMVIIGVITQKERDAAERRQDAAFILTLVATRGTNIQKLKGKSKVEMKERMERLIKKYGIKAGKPTTATTVTLARFASCFPVQMLGMFHSQKVQGVVSNQLLGLDYPRALRSPTFGSVIPAGEEWNALADAFALHQILFDRVINRTKYASGISKATKSTIMEFINIQRTSKLLTEAQKIGVLTRIRLIAVNPQTGHYIYEPAILKYAQIWVNFESDD